MPSKSEAYQYYKQNAYAFQQVQQLGEGRKHAEDVRQQAAAQLGTEEQVAGFGTSAEIVPFTQRYAIDAGMLGAASRGHKYINPEAVQNKAYQALDQANDLMEQAEAAARAGNLDQANALKVQAENSFQALYAGDRAELPSDAEKIFYQTSADVSTQAEAALTGTLPELVGGRLRMSSLLFQRGSPERRAMYETLTGDSVAAFEEGRRDIENIASATDRVSAQAMTQFGRKKGALRDIRAEGALRSAQAQLRTGFTGTAKKQLAVAESRVVNGAALEMEAMIDKMITGDIGLAIAFTQNLPGVRENFVGAMDNLLTMQLQSTVASAGRAAAEYSKALQKEAERKAGRINTIKAITGSALTVLAAAVGGPMGAAAAAAATSASNTPSPSSSTSGGWIIDRG